MLDLYRLTPIRQISRGAREVEGVCPWHAQSPFRAECPVDAFLSVTLPALLHTLHSSIWTPSRSPLAGCSTSTTITASLQGSSPCTSFYKSPWRLQEPSPPSSFGTSKGSHCTKLLPASAQCPVSCSLCTLPMYCPAILFLNAIAIKPIEGAICFLL